jgi:chemotaxis signal transduction protein
VLLWEISKTGARTKSVFERSIKNLRETVVSTILSNVSFLASLAIDIMDRNLYERANDCRWWALTSAFRSMLAKGPFTLDDRQTATDILKYINGLYTVYSNLFLFDRSGTVLAVSNPKYTSAIGRVLTDRYIHDTLSNHRSQWYTASPFVRSDLYDNDFTYIYAASITSNTDSHRIVGGIGIVFDSTPQFAAMIRDSLPLDQNQEPSADCFGAFIDRNKNVISSTSPNIPVGEKLDIPDELVNQASGEGCSRIIPFNGSYYGVGAHTSAGYREYKGEGDSYKNDVTALIFVPLAEEKRQLERASTSETLLSSVKSSRRLTGSNSVEIASFFVGEHWLGVNANRVVEAVRMGQVNKVPHAPQSIAGITIFNERVIPVLNFHSRIGHTIEFQNEQTQIVVLQSELGMWGLIADRLGPIPTVDNTDIDSKCGAVSRSESFVMGLVGSTGSEKWERVLILLDPMKVMNELLKGSSPEVMKALALPTSTT